MSPVDSQLDQPPTIAGERQATRAVSRSGWTHTFAALRHRNFRLFWCGQLISMTGTWMQAVAQSWLVLEMTNSALLLGVVSALQFLPVVLFSVFAGVVADRFSKRRMLLITQSSAMALALTLGVLTGTGLIQVWHVMILAFGLGLVNAFDWPLRQTFLVEMVGKEDLMNAVGLNNAIFNGSRVFGPALGGVLIGWLGLATCFYLNSVSFLAVIAGLLAMKLTTPVQRHVIHGSVWHNLAEGFRYIRNTKTVWMAVLLVGIMSMFGMNFNVIMPLLARETFSLDAAGFGYLMATMGLGSVMASFAVASIRRKPQLRRLLVSAMVFGAMETVLALESMATTPDLLKSYAVPLIVLAVPLIVVVGFTYVLFTASANSSLQAEVPDQFRGRVLSIYTLVLGGAAPMGNLAAGAVAHNFGAPAPLLMGGLVCLVAALVAFRALRPAS